jgi:hypothetical protein
MALDRQIGQDLGILAKQTAAFFFFALARRSGLIFAPTREQ